MKLSSVGKKAQEETSYLLAAVESKASLRLVNVALRITQIFDTKEFENNIH